MTPTEKLTCLHCGKQLRRCGCGAAQGRTHLVDMDAHGSRWCLRTPGSVAQLHELAKEEK